MTVNSIVAVGVGNGGIGAIERMIAHKLTDVKFVAVSNGMSKAFYKNTLNAYLAFIRQSMRTTAAE